MGNTICELNLKENVIISIIIPVYNEKKYIEKCISSILKQNIDKKILEVLFIDGNSIDGTKNIINFYAKKIPYIYVLDNPKRKIPNALNIGIKNAKGKYIVRMDAHSEYAFDYVSKCIECLEKTKADNVGGPVIARGKSPIQKVVAAAYHSPFALGGGKSHGENYEGYADTVFLGTFRKDIFSKIGFYNENILYAEDDELNYRIIKNGGKIYISPEIKSVYYPRSNYKDLFKQYFNYGFSKVAVIKTHKRPAKILHLIPVLFLLFLLIGFVLSIIFTHARYFYISVLILYAILNLYFSFSNKRIMTFLDKLRLVLVHFIIHISYGIGFFIGIINFFILRK